MNGEKKISIIIPAYNSEPYIEKCISSVIKQTYVNIEIIIVIDDTSKDNTNEVVGKLATMDKRIKIVQQHKKKLGEARNGGLDVSTGHYIMFLDADDWLEEDACEIVISEIVCENADILFFNYTKEYGRESIPHISYNADKLLYSARERTFFIYDMKNCTAWGKIYKRELIAENRFDTTVKEAEDVEFNFRIYADVKKAVYIKNQLLHYRVLQSSAVHGYDPEKITKFEYTLSLVKKNLLSKDKDKTVAYYSFAAIIYILICQNCVYLDPDKKMKEKRKMLKEIGKRETFIELFNNLNFVNVPLSRKIIPILGKYHFYLEVLTIIWIKQSIERGR